MFAFCLGLSLKSEGEGLNAAVMNSPLPTPRGHIRVVLGPDLTNHRDDFLAR